ncbi:efflux RND transporter periplasmic adaptor subunit [Clostridium saccharoperbutylacetonicum]|uniref:efflux RND transporter periplasmic adaptor subunit n=1 Tax=Clostridium saccharoperbutylacetonicum TaxID=36745 RepID=UPI0009838C09|nr:efflux RND transporter periplasmic adaptor subunit [Clostridium saccharoperbutylacetonicum]AQR97182.1 multidrug resistance protein MdtA precursor [Clostridium saccharoperbutylacetonicum]NSB33063.1 RND family efflux transporter MFP subunit [Clostridium saccharoperbutylacetonicum]
MKNVKKIVICAVLIIAVVSAIVVKNKMASNAKNVNTVTTESKTAVEVKTAKSAEKNNGDTYKATLEAYQQGVVTSKLSAKVISVAIENGKYVNAGDIIATLDNQDIQNSINSAQAQLQVIQQQLNSTQVSLQKLQINLDDAQRNYNRQKTLFDGKAISQTDLEAAEKALNNAKADYNTGEASIETSKANLEAQNVSIAKYQSDLANTVIKAPISGVISDKALSVGQMVSTGGVLAKVNDISSVYATIQVPQEKISSIKTGQAATVKIEGNDKAYDGRIQNIEALADTTTRVFNCKIKIDNSDKSLYPGVYAKAELSSSEKIQIITVPINALVGTEGNYSVFINDNGKAKKEKVKIGETDDNNVEIDDGVKDGDQIICSNTGTLQDGDTIDVTSSTSDNSSNGDSAKDVSK